MSNPKNLLVAELNALLRLTQTEATIANARVAQARSGRIAEELAENAENCNERSLMISEAVRDLGHVPDVVGSVAGRVNALAKTVIEQGQPLTEALLGDLALEHQLLDRTRFARVLASEAGEDAVLPVLDRLEQAHTATIDWLMTRLSEIAVGGPSAIQPAPSQVLMGAGRRLAQLPSRGAVVALNQSFAAVGRIQERAEELVETNLERVRELSAAAGEIWAAGRDATLGRTEEMARAGDDRRAARRLNRTRRALGAVEADELPIRNYDDLNAEVAISRLERLDNVDDVRTVMAYEAANKQRKGVMRAAEARFEELSASLIAAS
jgi:bacterioferritin (cytochrome b1)